MAPRGTVPPVPERSAIREIVRELDSCEQLTASALARALRRPVGIEDVAPWMRFDPGNYVRSLVADGGRWELRLLCWQPGQTTALHGHGGAGCAFRVLRGSAVEKRLGSRDAVLPPRSVVEEGPAELVHQVGNAGSDPLLTLHAYAPPLPVDTPAPRAGRNVVIVGAGAAGLTVAMHLLDRGGADLRIYLVERGPWLGRGIAYGVDDPVFRLNLPASSMSLDPRRPDDFVHWSGAEPDDFLSRATYADYVVDRFARAVRTSRAKARIVRGEVVDVGEHAVRLADGSELRAEAVVLATGIAPRLAPSPLPPDPRIVDAWDECGLATLPRQGRLLVLGTGLSALDVVAFWHAQGFEGSLTLLSRRGLLPRPHLPSHRGVVPLAPGVADHAPTDLRGLTRWIRATFEAHEARGEPWQLAVDALRPHVASLYRRLSAADRARFVRSVRPYWDVLRHRAPADVLSLVEALRQNGRLEVLSGSVVQCRARDDGLTVDLSLVRAASRSERFDAIVRCLGPALETSEAATRLVRAMVTAGIAMPDPAGLGIVTDEQGRVVGPDGVASDRLFALGAVRRASSWETTSMPEITAHALEIAARIGS